MLDWTCWWPLVGGHLLVASDVGLELTNAAADWLVLMVATDVELEWMVATDVETTAGLVSKI